MNGLRRAAPSNRLEIEAFQRAAYARTEVIIGARAIPLEWDYGTVMEECEVWLDEADGELAGVLILRILADSLFLESIATSHQASGSGRGRAMLQATFGRAVALGLNRVGLVTNSRNPAIAWYRNMGFVVDREEVRTDRTVLHMSAPAAAGKFWSHLGQSGV